MLVWMMLSHSQFAQRQEAFLQGRVQGLKAVLGVHLQSPKRQDTQDPMCKAAPERSTSGNFHLHAKPSRRERRRVPQSGVYHHLEQWFPKCGSQANLRQVTKHLDQPY